MPTTPGPQQFFIMPDPYLVGKDNVTAFTNASGSYPARAVPATTNEGSGSAFLTGTYSTPAGFNIRCMASGGVYSGGTWGWKGSKETPTQTYVAVDYNSYRAGESVDSFFYNWTGYWRGMNDLRYGHAYNPPTFTTGIVPYTEKWYSLDGCYIPHLRREIYYITQSSLTITAAYRDEPHVPGNEENWTVKNITIADTGNDFFVDETYLGRPDSFFAVCVLRDGKLRMATRRGSDIDIYESTDGLSWSKIADDIVNRFTTTQCRQVEQVCLAASGDWLRLCWVDHHKAASAPTSTYPVRTLISADRGASWVEVNNPDGAGEIFPFEIGRVANPYCYTLVAADDDAGTFILYAGQSTSACTVYTATRDESWLEAPEIGGSSGVLLVHPYSVAYNAGGARGAGWIYFVRHQRNFGTDWARSDQTGQGSSIAHAWDSPSTVAFSGWDDGDTLEVWLVDPANIRSAKGWKRLKQDNNHNVWVPRDKCNITVVNCGSYMGISWSNLDNFAYTQDNEGNYIASGGYFRLGGWDTRPIKEAFSPKFSPPAVEEGIALMGGAGNIIPHQPGHDLYRIKWFASMGMPSAGGDNYPLPNALGTIYHGWPWEEVLTAGAGGFASNPAHLLIYSDTVVGGGDYQYFKYNGAESNSRESNSWTTTSTINDAPGGSCIEWVFNMNAGGDCTRDEVALKVRGTPWAWGGSNTHVMIEAYHDSGCVAVWDTSATTEATATVTVADPLTAAPADKITIGGIDLVGVVGPSLLADQFMVGASAAACATNMASAINTATNSFTSIATATSVGKVLTLTAVPTGTSGNSTTLTATVAVAGALAPSGATFAGGLDTAMLFAITGDMVNYWWTFRLVFRPIPGTSGTTDDTQVYFAARRNDQTYWRSKKTVVTPATGVNRISQHISFGHHGLGTGGAAGQNMSRWKSVSVLGFSDCVQTVGTTAALSALWTTPDNTRGQLMVQDPVYIESGANAHWVGLGTFENDHFLAEPEYNFHPGNVFLQSPRVQWRSTSDGSTAFVGFQAASGNTYLSFDHNACAVFGTNVPEITVQYDTDSTFASPPATFTLDAKLYDGLRIASSGYQKIVLDTGNASLPSDGELVSGMPRRTRNAPSTTYIKITTGSYSGKVYRIMRQVGQTTLHIDDVGTPFASLAGQSCLIFGDRASVVYGSGVDSYPYMRLSITATETAEDYYKIGTVVAGISLPISVPMDWAFQNAQQPNITEYRTRSAVRWGFVEGPPQRVISGRVIGDVQQWRVKFRRLLQQTAEYSNRCLALCLDDQQLNHQDSLILGYVSSGGDLDNAAWYLDSAGTWRSAGDISIQFDEDV